jgi:predicted ribosomally synthesized peptide with nif11-like leader
MSQQSLKQFSAALESDPALHSKIQAAKSAEEMISIAAQHGHSLTLEELKTTSAFSSEAELADADLADVAGGTRRKTSPPPNISEIVVTKISDSASTNL